MTSTVQQRIKSLENFRAKQIKEQEEEQARQLEEKANLIKEIRARKQRITDLITLANACLNNGIKLELRDSYGSSNRKTFIAESFYHSLGFCNKAEYSGLAKSQVEFIGFNGGGACGKWHFRTNGDVIAEYAHTHDLDIPIKQDVEDISINHLKKFVEKFDEFETRFLEYVDSFQV